MRCAVSFLSVCVLVTAVGIAAFVIIYYTGDNICWKCKENGKCIPFKKRCNGVSDCINGSDEDLMDCHDMTSAADFITRVSCDERNANTSISIDNSTNAENIQSNSTDSDYSTQLISMNESVQGCNLTGERPFCFNEKMNSLPWDEMNLNAIALTLVNVFSIDEITAELKPPKNTNISLLYEKLYVENNTIRSFAEGSLCNWNNACWMTIVNNSLEHIDSKAFCHQPQLKWLLLSKNKLTLKGFRFRGMPKLSALYLNQNLIEEIHDDLFRRLDSLVSLNLGDNRIHSISERAFRYNTKLDEILLTNNRIIHLKPDLFSGQKKLQKLFLGYNPIENMSKKLFSALESLRSLKLEGIDIEAIDFDALNKMPKLDVVHLKKFNYCWYLPKVSRCFPFNDGMSSLVNLLAGNSIRWIVWIVALLTLVGNTMVLLSRCFVGGRGRILDVFINNLAGADFLMGIYLTTLAVKDVQYGYSYNTYAYEWSTSLLCSGIGILAMISSEVSLLILTIMSVERYLVISDPFSYHKKLSLNLARLSMMIIWIFVTVLAVAPAIHWRGKLSFYGSTSLCFPVHLDDAFSIGWEYTSFVIVGLNSVCLIIVAISYSLLFCVIRKTRLSTPVDVKDMEMALRFFLMVFTDCLCWLPIILLKVYALSGQQVPKELITWVVIFVLPINSTINPYLYTLSMPENRTKLFRRLVPTSVIRHSMSLISVPVRRNNRTTTSTEDSRGTWDASNSNGTTGESKVVSRRNQLSYQESIASSKLEETF